ncbi:hypothetical protein BS78_09G247800 [Paspalum vaginatum]|nr:hypothetical protein BS78_09G247800 [Paspalum vaginatum]
MAPLQVELNEPIDWDGIREWEGPAHQLDYDLVWEDHPEDVNEQVEGAHRADISHDAGADVAEQVEEEQGHGAQEDHPLGEQGSNRRKRTFYTDDIKIAIYLELLAKTDPPVLHRGVSREVAHKFGVPRRVVQRIWRQGQDAGGVSGAVVGS